MASWIDTIVGTIVRYAVPFFAIFLILCFVVPTIGKKIIKPRNSKEALTIAGFLSLLAVLALSNLGWI